MGWEGVLTLLMLGMALAAMVFTNIAPDLAMLGGVVVLLLTGVLEPSEALRGLSNEGLVTVAVLFVVSAGMRETGAIDLVAQRLFGRPKSAPAAIARLIFPVTAISAFVNNTPLVAMLIPAVADWAKRQRIAASKLMIPLSYAAILGGTCSLIGTSTNIVVDGLFIKAQKEGAIAANMPGEAGEVTESQKYGLAMFEITKIGVPAAIVGCAYILLTSPWLLPDRRPAISQQDDPRSYTAEMLVEPDSPLVGRSIEEAGLRHLPGVYLAEIDRDGLVLPAVAPQERLRANDRLVFVGIVESVVDLQKMRGLIPATDQVFKLESPRNVRCMIEAVVSNTCPLVGKTIRDGNFRTVYNAVVVAVARNGERINKKIGDVALWPGDTLLLEAHPSFVDQQRNSRDFFLVGRLENSNPPRHERAFVALAILIGMVTVATLGWLSMLQAAFLAAALMMLTRCCSAAVARRTIDWQVLLAIAASFAFGDALVKTGAARAVAEGLIGAAQQNPWAALGLFYAVTLLLTELITNNAAAALMFPLALATAKDLDVSVMPFVIAVMMAASAGFATPIGYQTNLMVYGPGGYRFNDYVKIGVPLDILIGVVTVGLSPFIWPFAG
ncbi:MAG: SLC13 family permease [Planctomycetia bacterium]|nr:SLC13 family permease [Planctomycetia bacterium]